MKRKLDLEINLYQQQTRKTFDLGEIITGTIKVRPLEDLEIQEFGIHLVKIVTDDFSTQEKIILTKQVCTNEILYQHETYRFPIEFTNYRYESYESKKAQITFQLKPYLITRREGKIKNEGNENAINFIDRKGVLWAKSNDFNFITKQPKYTIPPQNKTIPNNSCGAVFLYSFLFFFIAMVYIQHSTEKNNSFDFLRNGYLIGLIIIILVTQYINNYVLGKIYLNLEQNDNEEFIIYLKKERSWQNIYKIDAHFEIQEINYNKKKSTVRSRQVLYKSQAHKIKSPYESLVFSFKLPKNEPASSSIGRTEIVWTLQLKLATTFGLNLYFDWDFFVGKHHR